MAWTDMELAELAQCCRLGAHLARKDAEAAAVSVKDIHLKMAQLRERLAERLEAARKRLHVADEPVADNTRHAGPAKVDPARNG